MNQLSGRESSPGNTEALGSRVSGCGHRIMAITSAFQADDAGSIPAARSRRADMAQLVERTLGKGEVPSSTLGISTTSLLLPGFSSVI